MAERTPLATGPDAASPDAAGAAHPRLRRDPEWGVIGGVIAGFARRLGVDVVLLRVLFVVGVVASGGALLIGYALAWALIPAPVDATGIGTTGGQHGGRRGARSWHLGAGVGLLVLAALLIFRSLGIWWSDALVWPLVLVSAGLALLWGQSRSPAAPVVAGAAPGDVGRGYGRAGARQPAPATLAPAVAPAPADGAPSNVTETPTSFGSLYRGGFGIALVLGAALLFLSANDALGAARDAAFTAVVAIVALGLILAPFIWRLGRNLAAERTERIRSQERAEVAAHLHDSVLQTLTLMQKRSDDPREVAALARRQERELRDWLADRPGADGSGGFVAAIRGAAEEVEDSHRVKIEVVAVGDCELDEGAAAVVAAAREAMVNAAKFASDGPISLYAEVSAGRIEAYVRDRGPGFDPEAVPADRRGVRESIVGRVRRHGGEAEIRSIAGSGTEVAISLERSAP